MVLAYGINTDPNLPVVNVGNVEHPSYLPMEVCVVLQGQNARVVLPPKQTQEMIKFAVRKPWQNFDSIYQDGEGDIGLNPNQNPQMVRDNRSC